MTAVKNHLGEFGPVVSTEAELLALPLVTLVGDEIQVGQSFRVMGNVTLTPARYITVTAGGIVISEAQGGQITGAVASPGHLIGTAQNDLRIEDMKLQNTGSGSVVSVTGESPAIVRCTITAALGPGIVFGTGVIDTEIVDCEFFCNASAPGIELAAQRPLLVEGCALSTASALLVITPNGTTLNQRLVNNRVFGAGALVHFQCGAASQITNEYLVASNNSIESGPIVKITSPAASTAYVHLYDFSITGNKSQTTALIDSDLESTDTTGLDIFDGVISGNIVVDGNSGVLFRQRRAATTRWKEVAVTGNNFEAGGMRIDVGSNYAETCTFCGNSLGDNYPLFVHSHPSTTTNSSSFSGNSFESGGKMLEVRYPGIGGGLVRTSTFDGNAMISGTLITVTGTVVNPILQNCAINGNIVLTALSGASPFDNTTMGSNTEARGNYGVKDFGPGIVGDWNNLTLQNGFAGAARWRYLDGKARVEFEYYLNVGGGAIPLNTVFATLPTEARPYVGILSFMGGNKAGQSGNWHIMNVGYPTADLKVIQYGATVANEPQDIQGSMTWSVS